MNWTNEGFTRLVEAILGEPDLTSSPLDFILLDEALKDPTYLARPYRKAGELTEYLWLRFEQELSYDKIGVRMGKHRQTALMAVRLGLRMMRNPARRARWM